MCFYASMITNVSSHVTIVDMELTCLGPNPSTSTSDMDLTAPGSSCIHTREPEEDQVPEEFQL